MKGGVRFVQLCGLYDHIIWKREKKGGGPWGLSEVVTYTGFQAGRKIKPIVLQQILCCFGYWGMAMHDLQRK